MTNEQLAQFIQQGGNDELLPLLWDKTRLLIYKKCGQIWRFYSEKLTRHGYTLGDLEQEGYNALVFAVQQYKIEKGYKFTSYLNYALKHVIRDLLSGSDVLNQPGTQSLEKPLTEDKDGEQLLVGDVIPDERAAEVYDQIERLDEYNVLYAAVDELPREQRETVIEYYFKGLTCKQIDEKHDRTDGSARRLLIKAISTLRKGRTGERLRAVYGVDYGIKHKSLAAFRSSGTSEIEDYVMRRWGNCSPTE